MTASPPRQPLPAEQMRQAAVGPRASHLPSGQLPRGAPAPGRRPCPRLCPSSSLPGQVGRRGVCSAGSQRHVGGPGSPGCRLGPSSAASLGPHWSSGHLRGAGAEEPGEGGSLEWHPLAPLGEGVLWDRAAWPGGLGPGHAGRWVRIGSRVRCVAPAADAALAESTASTPAARGVGRRGVGGCVRGCAVGRSTGSGGTAPQKRRVSANISSGQIRATRPLTPRPAQRAACAHAHQTSRRSSGW